MTSQCQPNNDQFCYLAEAVQLILLGDKSNGSQTDILFNTPTFDNATLNEMLLLGLQQTALFITNNPSYMPGDFNYLIPDLVRIITLLEINGSLAVTWYDLKYYIQRFITPPNVAKLLAYNFREAPKNAKTYFNDIYLKGIKTPGCRKAWSLWLDAMAQPTRNVWAIRMFDAIGKPPTNLLAANTNWLGNWQSCHKVKYSNASFQFKGRYCRAKVRADPILLAGAGPALEGFPGDPAALAAIDLGLCVPDFCENEDVAALVNHTLRLLTIHQFSNVHYADGVQCESPIDPPGSYYVTIVIITILTTIVVLATSYDCLFRSILNKPYATASTLSMQNLHTLCNFSSSREQPHGIFYKNLDAYQYQFSNRLRLHGMSYPSEAERTAVSKSRKHWYNQLVYRIHRIVIDLSAYTAILKPMSNSGAMKCLNGLRVISMGWIIFGHTYNYIGDQSYFLLTQNALDLLDFQKRFEAQLIINALYGVDTFFLISAMLITLSLMRMLKKNGMPKWYFWPMMYLERYLRLIPPYIMVFLLYIYVVPFIGQGPLWTAKDFPMKNSDCHDYWWAYFLLINNFVPNGVGTRCMGYYWYVSNDFQLFLIAPFLIVPLYYFPIIGSCILLGVLFASSCILAFNIANTYRVGQILVTLQAIWEDTYTKPYCRAAPYIIGIVLGYIFFKTENQKKKIHLHPIFHLLFWALTIVFMATSIFGNWTNHKEGGVPMTPSEYVLYFVLSRIAWPLAISWIIFSCTKGLAPLIDTILSWRGFTFFAHISYTTYLIHPMIMVYYMFAQQNLFHATDITLLYIYFGHFVFSLILGLLAHLIFERPFGVLISLLLPKRQR
ncbi:unnamed protein product [Adineta steineri]|uniref:Nose resistant-to-fluoxetine protein N-terminal domain-containing protein n=1 Tax=Adineta steineri TaxID=433720 RepID=A0A815VFH7_9BILA|nr:unnamed protein product [Adineta steineri]CAF1654115.1 unnamed protein product [Adineta steineri]